MPYVNVNGLEFFYEDDCYAAPWRDPEVVWIQHGFGRSSQFFHHWVPALSGQYRVLRRDMRGHGRSGDPAPDHPWSREELLDDMVGFLDALSIDSVHYVGDSTGGQLGAAFAAQWPQRLKSLTMVSTPIADANRNSDRYGYQDLATAVEEMPIEDFTRMNIRGRGLSVLSPEHEAWVLKEWSKNRVHCLLGIARTYGQVDLTEALRSIRTPTLFLAPTSSPTVELEEQRRMCELVPGAQIAEIEGEGHEIYVDRADACLAALKQFLGTLDAPDGP